MFLLKCPFFALSRLFYDLQTDRVKEAQEIGGSPEENFSRNNGHSTKVYFVRGRKENIVPDCYRRPGVSVIV